MRKKQVKKIRRMILFTVSLLISTAIIFQFFDRIDKLNKDTYKKVEALTSNNEDNSGEKEQDYDEGQEEISKEEVIDQKEDTVVNLDNSGYINLEDDINADDASKVLPETMYKWNFYRQDGKRIAYLTFDDGPSEHSTEKILDILKNNDIKATFFILGSSIENHSRSKDILKRIAKEGHAIGSHGYSHNYSQLYPNRTVDVRAFMEDFKKNDNILKEMLGNDFSTRLIRLPGGHSSWNGTEALDEVLKEKDIWQVDWNSLNGDAEGKDFPKEILLNKLKETVGDQDTAIILMHDTDSKKGTVEYLQSAIDYLKSEGFEFRTLK